MNVSYIRKIGNFTIKTLLPNFLKAIYLQSGLNYFSDYLYNHKTKEISIAEISIPYNFYQPILFFGSSYYLFCSKMNFVSHNILNHSICALLLTAEDYIVSNNIIEGYNSHNIFNTINTLSFGLGVSDLFKNKIQSNQLTLQSTSVNALNKNYNNYIKYASFPLVYTVYSKFPEIDFIRDIKSSISNLIEQHKIKKELVEFAEIKDNLFQDELLISLGSIFYKYFIFQAKQISETFFRKSLLVGNSWAKFMAANDQLMQPRDFYEKSLSSAIKILPFLGSHIIFTNGYEVLSSLISRFSNQYVINISTQVTNSIQSKINNYNIGAFQKENELSLLINNKNLVESIMQNFIDSKVNFLVWLDITTEAINKLSVGSNFFIMNGLITLISVFNNIKIKYLSEIYQIQNEINVKENIKNTKVSNTIINARIISQHEGGIETLNESIKKVENEILSLKTKVNDLNFQINLIDTLEKTLYPIMSYLFYYISEYNKLSNFKLTNNLYPDIEYANLFLYGGISILEQFFYLSELTIQKNKSQEHTFNLLKSIMEKLEAKNNTNNIVYELYPKSLESQSCFTIQNYKLNIIKNNQEVELVKFEPEFVEDYITFKRGEITLFSAKSQAGKSLTISSFNNKLHINQDTVIYNAKFSICDKTVVLIARQDFNMMRFGDNMALYEHIISPVKIENIEQKTKYIMNLILIYGMLEDINLENNPEFIDNVYNELLSETETFPSGGGKKIYEIIRNIFLSAYYIENGYDVILVLDEVTTGMDPKLKYNSWLVIKLFNFVYANNLSTVMIEHDAKEWYQTFIKTLSLLHLINGISHEKYKQTLQAIIFENSIQNAIKILSNKLDMKISKVLEKLTSNYSSYSIYFDNEIMINEEKFLSFKQNQDHGEISEFMEFFAMATYSQLEKILKMSFKMEEQYYSQDIETDNAMNFDHE